MTSSTFRNSTCSPLRAFSLAIFQVLISSGGMNPGKREMLGKGPSLFFVFFTLADFDDAGRDAFAKGEDDPPSTGDVDDDTASAGDIDDGTASAGDIDDGTASAGDVDDDTASAGDVDDDTASVGCNGASMPMTCLARCQYLFMVASIS